MAEERQEYSREIALPTQIATPHRARRRSEQGRAAVAKKEQTTLSEETREPRGPPGAFASRAHCALMTAVIKPEHSSS